MNSTLARVAWAATVALALAACTPPDASPSPSDAAAPTSTAEPSVTVTTTTTTSTTTDPGDGGDGDVHLGPPYDFGRYEFILAGESFADYAGVDGVAVAVEDICPWNATITVPGQDPNIYVTWFSSPSNPAGPARVFLMSGDTTPGVIVNPITNDEGIGIGTSATDVLAAYPGSHIETSDDEAWGTVNEIRVDDPDSDARYYFWVESPTGPVYRVQWGFFPTDSSLRGHLCSG